MSARLLAVLAAGALAAAALSACQSTQATSAERAAKGATLLDEKDIEIAKESSDIEVVQALVFPGKDTSTVAVELKNNSQTGQINVPIQLDVRDSKGKTVFKNNTAGTEPSLVSAPVVGPGADVWWVHDQVFAVGGTPDSVKVQVGQSSDQFPEIPEVSVTQPKLAKDPISGLPEASGHVTNESDEDLKNVYLYAVATKGDQVVAAGRAAIQKLKVDAKRPAPYHIFFTAGDPDGAEIEVTATPTFFTDQGA